MTKSYAVQPQRIDIHRDFINLLSEQEIYSLTLLAHIHNEITTLMRILTHTIPKKEQTSIERAGSFQMMHQIARLLCGKIYEAKEKIYQKQVQEFISKWCIPFETEKSVASLSKEFTTAFNQSKWLHRARNRHAMHYPKIDEWTDAIDYTSQNNFEIIVGSNKHELLFRTADVAAFAAFSLEVDDTDVSNGISKMADEIGPLALALSQLTTQALGGFVQASRLSDKKRSYARHKEGKKFKTIEMESFEIPFFFHLNE
ncbi:hypothetical protein [Burkholderia sp. MBR-1]|uniref:hypothetical protein n=1 Tax=Burkholderia sp. MBR-1 TaxID=2732364 RepID=UPI0015EEF3AA|nr:hypothetical protein [Burkholderia sp. MBR-1]QMI45652.1 hypothetical protein MBR110_09410 [Burkholderia sp. MBR-1]